MIRKMQINPMIFWIKSSKVASANFTKKMFWLISRFVKDPSKTIGELVGEKIASIKENITIRRFTRYKMGEGIEKKVDDFADEVASMVGS